MAEGALATPAGIHDAPPPIRRPASNLSPRKIRAARAILPGRIFASFVLLILSRRRLWTEPSLAPSQGRPRAGRWIAAAGASAE